MISKEQKAKIIQLAMDIDLGIINLEEALKVIRENKEVWIPILQFMESFDDLTKSALDRLYLESRYLRSLY